MEVPAITNEVVVSSKKKESTLDFDVDELFGEEWKSADDPRNAINDGQQDTIEESSINAQVVPILICLLLIN